MGRARYVFCNTCAVILSLILGSGAAMAAAWIVLSNPELAKGTDVILVSDLLLIASYALPGLMFWYADVKRLNAIGMTGNLSLFTVGISALLMAFSYLGAPEAAELYPSTLDSVDGILQGEGLGLAVAANATRIAAFGILLLFPSAARDVELEYTELEPVETVSDIGSEHEQLVYRRR